MPGKRGKTLQIERDIVEFIKEYVLENGFGPSLRDIQTKLNFGSASNVKYHVDRMLREGTLGGDANIARSLHVPGYAAYGDSIRIPVMGGIRAGTDFHLPEGQTVAEVDPDFDFLQLPENMLPKQTDKLYALVVEGDSMVDALIGDGDTVVVRKADRAAQGDMVAARIERDGEFEQFTLKHYYKNGNDVTLMPAHPSMKPIEVHATEVDILGKVIVVLREYHSKPLLSYAYH